MEQKKLIKFIVYRFDQVTNYRLQTDQILLKSKELFKGGAIFCLKIFKNLEIL